MRAREVFTALEVVFRGVRLQLSVVGLVTSTLATLSGSHLLAEVAAKLALTLVAVAAAGGALLGSNRRRYILATLALPILTLLYYSTALPKVVLTDLVLLPIMSLILCTSLAYSSSPPGRFRLLLLNLFSACYAITSVKVLDLGLEPTYRVLWQISLSLALVAIGLAGHRALQGYVEQALNHLENRVRFQETSATILRKCASSWSLTTDIERLPNLKITIDIDIESLSSLKNFLDSATRAIGRLEKTLSESIRKASLVVETVQNYVENSLTYSLTLLGFLSVVALIVYAIITTLR